MVTVKINSFVYMTLLYLHVCVCIITLEQRHSINLLLVIETTSGTLVTLLVRIILYSSVN